jgi:acetyl/propionyl-CoA carboxylase alpha subunit/acetyl-CoA carboxylase carboxyltransferase component
MSFRRIAIVNRGDAASRCLRAIHELRAEGGPPLTAIALYTEPDRAAPFVREADEALSLGAARRGPRGAAPRLAYLDRARVLAALRATHADSVWPGWGFLAEDAAFVEQLEQRGIVFIGPSSAAMRALGDKIAAKRLAESCAVPVAPWSGGAVSVDAFAEAAGAVGLPFLIKAAAGGGGRGIRLVERWEDGAAAFERATAEATGAFGDGTVFLETLLPRSRHVEVQIAADRGGHCLALGLRDCSVQRRHQKVIEEAPPPRLAADVDAALRAAAVRLAQAAGYVGVGTVEFLLAPDGRSFYFLEVNPRLQVEPGLTEMLTGLDLVKLQIAIARGDALPPSAPPERGHAIEARVCAEDPAADFAPAPGAIVLFDVPGGPGVRTDTGVSLGCTMPAEFDQLIAKVIAHAPTRPAALARLTRALDELRLVLDGGATNKGVLLDLLAAEAIRRGGVDVDWLDRTIAALPPPAHAAEALMAAAILVYQEERVAARLNFFAETLSGAPRSIPDSTGQSIELTYRGAAYRLHVLAIGDWGYRIGLDGRECLAQWLAPEPHAGQLVVGDARYRLTLARDDGGLRVEVNGRAHRIGRDTGGVVRASAPAVVIALDVAPGQAVDAGQRLGLLETMKVEVAFHAPISGTVAEVLVRRNERVAAGAALIRIQAVGATAAAPATAGRVALPDWTDPLLRLFDDAGQPDLAAAATRALPERERSLAALTAAVQRVLLGYDQRPDIDAQLRAVLTAPLPHALDGAFLAALAEVRSTLRLFADTELLFSRQPDARTSGAIGPSNDAWLRLYLRRIGARGAGLPDHFLALLRRAMAHYGCGALDPSDALERALLRLFAAHARAEERYRLVGDLLRFVTRLVAAGADVSDDAEFAAALATCIALRGVVADGLADAATEARYTIFELPAMRRRAARATAALEHALEPLERGAPRIDNQTLLALSDSPPQVFERVAPWADSGDPLRRDLALQALVLRQYAPLVPTAWANAAPHGDRQGRPDRLRAGHAHCRLDYAAHGIVLAALARPSTAAAAWDALCDAAEREATPALLELIISGGQAEPGDDLHALVEPLLARRSPRTRRLCCTALQPDGSRTYIAFTAANGRLQERDDLLFLHPETVRRLDLARLSEFALERLPGGEGIYAFHGRSRSIPGDERIFVFAEVRAALPGATRQLHEPAFVHAVAEAVRVLRAIRSERDQMRRLHWNRITLVVRPALSLLPETLSRLVRELAPSARHLGLEKIVVRLALYERHARLIERPRELVIEPTAGGRIETAWRDPHHDPLQPATDTERRIAESRRRGFVYPYEAIRALTAGGGQFTEFDLDAERQPVSVAGRAGANTCGIVFGLITTPTAKYPEGMTRVLVLSDPTRDFGALAAPECDRLVAALDIAAARGVPLEWIATSGGARIAMDSGTENLDATARVVRRIVEFTAAGGEINVIVAGINVGAQSYFNALATMLPSTRGVLIMLAGSSMVLTGRLALEASGGVGAEDELAIGGFERIMGPSGQAQYYARDLAQAYEILLQHYHFAYCAPGERRPRRLASRDAAARSIGDSPYPADEAEGFTTVADIFDDATNPGRKRAFAMRPVMQALIDRDGDRLERWGAMAGAETAIVWDAHIGGNAVCLIGIESRNLPRLGARANDGPSEWTGGTLFPLSSKKVARALRAASGNRPAVILANLSGFDGSPESMRSLQLEYGAEIARAVVEFQGPLLFVVVSRYHGGAYVVFSRALNERLHAIALQGSYASVIGGNAAATAVFGREVWARTESDPRLQAARAALRAERDPERSALQRAALERLREQIALEQHGAVAREFDAAHSVERALAVGSLDRIVAVADLRRYIIDRLDADSNH